MRLQAFQLEISHKHVSHSARWARTAAEAGGNTAREPAAIPAGCGQDHTAAFITPAELLAGTTPGTETAPKLNPSRSLRLLPEVFICLQGRIVHANTRKHQVEGKDFLSS